MSDKTPFRWPALLALGAFVGAALASPATPSDAPEPLTVARAVELALAHAPAVVVALATEAEASAAARAAEHVFRPEAALRSTPGFSGGVPGTSLGELPAVAAVEVRQVLFDPARRADALEAQARRALSRAGIDTTKAATARSVILAYGRCWADEALVAAAERRSSVSVQQRERVEALLREGRATPVEVERAALQEARARQARLDRLSDRDLDQLELRQLIGAAPNVPLLLAGDPMAAFPETPPGDDTFRAWASDAESRELSAAIQALERAETWRGRSWAPVVDLGAQYARLIHYKGYDEFYRAFDPNSWGVGFSISVPLGTGRAGDELARVRAARGRLIAQRRAREGELDLQTRRAEAALGAAVARLSLARRAEGVAEEELRVARALSHEGRNGPGEVDALEIGLADAGDEATRAQGELLAARVLLLSLRGELVTALLPGPGGVAATPAAEKSPEIARSANP